MSTLLILSIIIDSLYIKTTFRSSSRLAIRGNSHPFPPASNTTPPRMRGRYLLLVKVPPVVGVTTRVPAGSLAFGELRSPRLSECRANGSDDLCLLFSARQFAPLSTGTIEKRATFVALFSMVPVVGIEPTRILLRGILSPVRLPSSPHRHVSARVY